MNFNHQEKADVEDEIDHRKLLAEGLATSRRSLERGEGGDDD